MVKWPSLPTTITKLVSLILFAVALGMECSTLANLSAQKGAYCIKGNELNYELGLYIFMISGVVMCDLVYVVLILIAMAIKRCNYGADINTIAYNIAAGAVCFGSIAKLGLRENCGNDAFSLIKDGTCGIASLAGIIHFVNAAFCLLFIAKEERTFTMNRTANVP